MNSREVLSISPAKGAILKIMPVGNEGVDYAVLSIDNDDNDQVRSIILRRDDLWKLSDIIIDMLLND